MGPLFAVHVAGRNYPDQGPGGTQGKGDMKQSARIGRTKGVVTWLPLAVLRVRQQ